MKCIDISGQKFGRLTAIKPIGAIGSDRSMWWLCKCECGNETQVPANHLKKGNTRSCGCLAIEKHCYVKTHGLRNDPLYFVWWSIIERCENPKKDGYHNYGGRGIRVCNEWKDVSNFIIWAKQNGWKQGLEIDRIDVNGNYEPGNCRFVTHKENSNNKRNNHYLTCNGKTQTLQAWADELGMCHVSILNRIESGWTIEEALTIPKGAKRQ